jgi:hypothetical protein
MIMIIFCKKQMTYQVHDRGIKIFVYVISVGMMKIPYRIRVSKLLDTSKK